MIRKIQEWIRKWTYLVIIFFSISLPVEAIAKKENTTRGNEQMSTKFQGPTGDASLVSNWSNYHPFLSTDIAIIPKTTNVAITSNFGSAPAWALVNLTSTPLDGETVTLDAKIYTFVTALDPYDGSVLIGADNESAVANLLAAINLDSGAGSTYGSLTTQHSTIYARTHTTAGSIQIAARTAGTGGNSIAVSEALSDGTITNGMIPLTNLTNGIASGFDIATIYVEKGYSKDIMTTGDPAVLECTKLKYEGSGTFYLNITGNITSSVIRSINQTNAVVFGGTTQNQGSIEIFRGKVTNNSSGLQVGIVYILSSQASYETSDTAGDHTDVYQTSGTSDISALITNMYLSGGVITKDVKDTTKLKMTGGRYIAKSNGSEWIILGGVVDTTQSADEVTVTGFVIDENNATLISNEDLDTFTIRYLGE